nr:unnamed protein product [Callosobruchus analis]
MAKHPEIADNRIFRRCTYCNKSFSRKIALDEHIVKRHPDFIKSISRTVHECTKCTYKTVITSELKQHIVANHPDMAGNHLANRCVHCNKTFVRKRTLDDHIIKTHPDFIASVTSKIHECTQCTYKTTVYKCIGEHLMIKHPEMADKRVFSRCRCIYCNKMFSCKLSLDDHIVKRHPDFIASVTRKVHKCTKCTFKTVSTSQLKQHMITHSDTARYRITCRCIYCNKTFTNKQALDDHIVKRHPDFIASVSSKVHECTECTYKTTSIGHWKRHLLVKHPDVAGDHITIRCIYCNQIFSSNLGLDDHIVKKHPDFIASIGKKVHGCTNCTYKTASISHLKRHVLVKHPDVVGDGVTNTCIYCNETFIRKRTLDDHIIKTHPDFIASVSSKIHECTECTYKTLSSSQLKQHMVKHPDIDGNRITSRCIYCDSTFTSKQALDDHTVKKHPDFIASVTSTVHECTKCTFKTIRTSHLKEHIMVKHPDIAGDRKTNSCIYCNKIFVHKRTLDDHILKTHPDFKTSVSGKIHECTKCTYKTVSESYLKKHISINHPDIAGELNAI